MRSISILMLVTAGMAGSIEGAQRHIAGGSTVRWTPLSQVSGEEAAQLESGHMLISSGGGFFGRKALNASLGGASFSCKGTAIASRIANQPLSITCLEGSLSVRLTAKSGSAELKAGEMMMLPQDSDSLPQASIVRLKRIQESHPLLKSTEGELAAMERIQSAIARQEKAMAKGKLAPSGLKVRGGTGTVSAATAGSDSRSSSSQTGGGSSSGTSGGSSSSSSGAGGGGTTGSSSVGAACG